MASNLPSISKELVDRLDQLIPNRCPDINMKDREIWYEAGKRSVVDFLKMSYNDQVRTIISKD